MAIRLPDGSIQMADGRIVYANSVILGADLCEIIALCLPPPAWPFVSGGGGGGPGPQGPAGPAGSGGGGGGSQGNQGFQGTNPGVQGPQGNVGAQGNQGNQGLTGTGSQGAQGFQGFSGLQGSQGFQGLASNAVFMQQTAIVDPPHGNDLTGEFGDLSKPFETIQAAINAVPTPAIGDSAGSRTVWVILVSPGTYDEDLVVDITRKRIILASVGPWNLGLFNSVDWQPSGTRRNITLTTTDAIVNDGIRNGFSIQPMLPAGEGLTTHQAYLTRPRISGFIDVSAVGGPSLELTLSAEVFGTTGGSGGTSIIGGAAIIQSYFYHCRFRGMLTGTNWNFQVNERTRFGGLVSVLGYSTILSCRFDAGMTVASAANAGITPGGFYLTDFAGTFTGPAGSLRLDGQTNYWFKTNGAVLAGGATKVIQDDLIP
jgi:hypothetical protein